MSRDMCYGEDFEERIAKFLEENGHKVYRSVYATYGKQTSQIDLVVFDGFMPTCIECKAWDTSRVLYKRSHFQWKYIGLDGSLKIVSNPIKQVDRHKTNLFMNMINDIEHTLPWRMTIPPSQYVIVIKGSISDYKSERIFTERKESLDELLRLLDFGNEQLPECEVEAIHKWLAEHSDTSPKRLKEHIKYLKECKKNKVGAFSENQY